MDQTAVPPDVMVFDPATQAAIDMVQYVYEEGGALALVALGIMFGVRIFRMLGGDEIWAALAIWWQRAIIFLTSFLGALGVAYGFGKPLLMALPSGFMVGVVAMIKHKVTEGLGRKVRLTGNPKVDAAMRLLLGDEQKPAKGQEPPAQ